jgi:iron complex outermembrane receptor protein
MSQLSSKLAALPAALLLCLASRGFAADSAQQFPEITISGKAEEGYVVPSTTSATRTDTPIEHIPQSVVVVPKKMIEDQGATTLSDITKNVSNVQAFDQRDVSTVTSFKIRGFNAGVSVDGVSTQGFFANLEPVWNIEQVDVIKGPTGSLYAGSQTTGSDSAGGLLAITSKAPDWTASHEVGIRLGSYSDRAVFFDLNQPLNDQVSIRLVGQVQDAESETDRLTSKQIFIAPSISWQPNADSKLTLRLRHSENEFLDYIGLPDQTYPRNQILMAEGQPNSRLEIDSANLQWTQRLNDIWSWGMTLAHNQTEFDGRGIFFNEAARQKEDMTSTTFSPYVTAKFVTGNLKHTGIAGFEYVKSEDEGYIALDPASLFNCFFLLSCSYTSYSVPYAPWVEPAAPASPYNTVSSRTRAVYLQDQIDFERFHVQLGLRHAEIELHDTYAGDPNALTPYYDRRSTNSKTVPRVGVVVDITSHVSAFAGYGETFRMPMYGAYTSPIKPEEAAQTEVGLRIRNLHGLSASLAWYDLTRKNIPANDLLGVTYQVGKQNSKGVDLDLMWQVSRELSLLANFSNQEAVTEENQYSPASVGKTLLGIPETTARMAARYDFHQGTLAGLGLGFGVRHHSRLAGNSSNTFFTPEATVYDAQVSYKMKSLKLNLSINNLFDKQYFVPSTQSQVMPALRRTATLSANLSF